MHVLRNPVARARQSESARALRKAAGPHGVHRLIVDQIGEMSAAPDAGALERLRLWIVRRPCEPARKVALTA